MSSLLDRVRPAPVQLPPNLDPLRRTIRRILDRYDVVPTPSERDAERLIAEMQQRIAAWDWHKVPMSRMTEVAGIVFAADWRDRPQVRDLQGFILQELAVSSKPGFLNPMVRIYIETYAPDAPSTIALGRALQAAKSRIGARWDAVIGAFPSLFDATRAHEEIAGKMAGMDDPWHGLLATGLRQPHAPGLMDAAHAAFLRQIRPQLRETEAIARLLGWIAPAGAPPRQTGVGAAIDALIAPWVGRDAPDPIKTQIIDRITEVYSHPRVRRHPAWNEVKPAHEALFLRWLMGADIRFLFRMLAEVERGHMWRDREDFWWTMLEQGRIDELWIAFNREGHAAAVSRLPLDLRQTGGRFARQTGERDKSLIIMRIGDKVVVEGTYNFMVHIFDSHHPRAPKLYEPEYDVSSIRHRRGAGTIVHNGDWQSKVRRALG